jgi:inward rectifier potassium channel
MKKKASPVSVRAGQLEFLKVNASGWEWRDAYHWILSLSWFRFSLLVLAFYLTLNLVFAAAYTLAGDCIAGMPPGSFLDAFFFSVQTLSTVGFGHLYPDTLYGNLVTTMEIVVGMFWMTVITGLIFVRFSRPSARVLFSKTMVISPFNRWPALTLRVANLRHHAMVEAEFRLMLIRNESIPEEEEDVRRFYALKLDFDRLIMFPAALTIRHIIDEQSPLCGVTSAELERCDARFMASVVCVDTVIPAPVQSQCDYSWREVHFGHRFVEIYTETGEGRLSVDYGRLHEIEPVTARD